MHVVLAQILWLLAGLLSFKDSLDKGRGIEGGGGKKGLQFGHQGYYISDKRQGQGYYSDKGQQEQGYYCLSQEFFGLPASAGSGIVTVLGIFLLF